MKIFYNKKKLTKVIHNEKNLGFVPTMGSLHNGHISLFKKSLIKSNKTIVSIFVNKPQFNKRIDFKNYPKKLSKDISLLKKLKINYLYIPKYKEIYPRGINKNIKINSFSKTLCGKFRPGHFQAVVDVVERFIKIINPKKIYFGEKDRQQLMIIKNFVKKKYSKIKVISCKTIREKNGTPYSSRNKLLSRDEKKISSILYKILLKNKKNLIKK